MSRRAGRCASPRHEAESLEWRISSQPKPTSCEPTARAALGLNTLLRSRPRLPGAVDAVFEAGQLLSPDRTSGVKSAGGDADLGAEPEFPAIGELCRCVMQHDCGIDLIEEPARGGFVFGYDRIGAMRTVIVNMRDRLQARLGFDTRAQALAAARHDHVDCAV